MENKKKELENNFNTLATDVSKSYLDKTQPKYIELESKIQEFLRRTEKKILEKCEGLIKNMIEVSHSETFVNENDNSMYIQMKPKYGKEKEYSVTSSQLIKCSQPYMSLAERLMLYNTNFNYMNNYSYSFCLNQCKTDMLNSYDQDKLDFNELKYCLKDCYNLSSFNYKSYYDYMSQGVKLHSDHLDKI